MYNLKKFKIDAFNCYDFTSVNINKDTIKFTLDVKFRTSIGACVKVTSIYIGEGHIEEDEFGVPIPCARDLYVSYLIDNWNSAKYGLLSSDPIFNAQLYQFLAKFGIERIVWGEVGAHEEGRLFYELLGDDSAGDDESEWDV